MIVNLILFFTVPANGQLVDSLNHKSFRFREVIHKTLESRGFTAMKALDYGINSHNAETAKRSRQIKDDYMKLDIEFPTVFGLCASMDCYINHWLPEVKNFQVNESPWNWIIWIHSKRHNHDQHAAMRSICEMYRREGYSRAEIRRICSRVEANYEKICKEAERRIAP